MKNPLGLMPRHVHEYKRAREIIEAMCRYIDAEKEIPRGWVEELAGLKTVVEAEP